MSHKQRKKEFKASGLNQSVLTLFCRHALGYAARSSISVYELASRALVARGHVRPPVMSFRSFCVLHAAEIRSGAAKERSKRRAKATPKQKPALAQSSVGSDVASNAFLMSYEWRRLRMRALKLHGARCQCCGATPADGVRMNVDHIKPRRLFPSLALNINNLQVLCEECNHGKGNWDMTDWRQHMSQI